MGCAVGTWGKVFVSMMLLRILGSFLKRKIPRFVEDAWDWKFFVGKGDL